MSKVPNNAFLSLHNIEKIIMARNSLVESIAKSQLTPEQIRCYDELDLAFINAIKAEFERLSSVREEEEPCKQN